MLIAVCLAIRPDGGLVADAPDFRGCETSGDTEESVLPRLRLAIEGEITRLLQHGIALPQTRDGAPPATTLPAADGTLRWLNVHINLAHLEALARHQSGR